MRKVVDGSMSTACEDSSRVEMVLDCQDPYAGPVCAQSESDRVYSRNQRSIKDKKVSSDSNGVRQEPQNIGRSRKSSQSQEQQYQHLGRKISLCIRGSWSQKRTISADTYTADRRSF